MTIEFCKEYDDIETINKLSKAIDDPELKKRIGHLALNYGLAMGAASSLNETLIEVECNLLHVQKWVEAVHKAHPNIDIDIENLE